MRRRGSCRVGAARASRGGVLCLPPREQARLKARVVLGDTEAWQRDPDFSGLRRVGGVDVSFAKGDGGLACASLVVLSYPELEVTLREPQPLGPPGRSRARPRRPLLALRSGSALRPGSTLSLSVSLGLLPAARPQTSAGIIDSRGA